MSIRILFSFIFLVQVYSTCGKAASTQNRADTVSCKNVFLIDHPNFELSPYAGMTREHWKDAALYLLKGAFSYVDDLNDPMKFPKQPGKSYPLNERQVPTEKLEGLCRTLFLAAPLLREDPDLKIGNIKVAEYYRHQILKLIHKESSSYIRPRSKDGGPSQNLVEFGALAISLFVVPDVIWEPFTQEEKDALAHTMLSYGDGPTVDSNWKFFNIFVLSFFKAQGYQVNEVLLEKYLTKSLQHYRGDGWYNDSPAYDYYSMWAFQLYGRLWSEFFGKEYYPEIAAQFTQNFNDLKSNYPYLYSRDGKMIMWGRSISYRMGSIAPFPLMGLTDDPALNYGWMRRIASGTILQFLQSPDFLKDSVPTLGFYGAFEPAVQNYSCRGSVYWMGKAFLGLLVPAESPFWTATENEGPWESEFENDSVYNKFQQGSNILITDYPSIGASEVRAWCHEKVKDDWQKFRSTENYNRLSYNSAFPWQADGPNGEVAMNYVLKNDNGEWEALRLFTFKKFEEGAYYRDAVLETNENIQFYLVDIPLPNGVLRVDKNISSDSVEMRLGHYALPQLNDDIVTTTKSINGYEATIIDNGEYQLAMIPLVGWQHTEVVKAEGLNPVSNKSEVLNVTASYLPKENGEIYATLMLWKKSDEEWTDSELVPTTKFIISDDKQIIQIEFKNGRRKIISYK